MPPGNPPPYGPPPSPYGQPPPNPYPPQPAPPYPPQPAPPYPPQPPAGSYPPPPPAGSYPPPPPGYYPPPQQKKNRGLLIAGLVLGGLVVLGIIVVVVFLVVVGKGTVTATNVAMGDCLKEIPASTRVLTVQTVGCDEPHAGEVFTVLQMPDGDYPGQSAIDEYTDRCSPALANYSPGAMEDESIQLYVLYPTPETWEQGDRAVTCIATLDPPRAGSIKG